MATIATPSYLSRGAEDPFTYVNSPSLFHPHIVYRAVVPIVQEEYGDAMAERLNAGNNTFSWGH